MLVTAYTVAPRNAERSYRPTRRVKALSPHERNRHQNSRKNFSHKQWQGETGVEKLEPAIAEDIRIEQSRNSIANAGREGKNRGYACEFDQPAIVMKLEKPEQQEPLRDFSDLYLGLHGKVQSQGVVRNVETTKEKFSQRREREDGHPEEQPLFSVAEPANQAENGDQGVQRGKTEGKLSAAQPLIIERCFAGGNSLGLPRYGVA